MGRVLFSFFFKNFLYVNVFYVNYRQDFQIRTQLMTDNIYSKVGPTRLYYGFRVKLMVFMALTNFFRKNFMDFLSFASFVIFFVAQ